MKISKKILAFVLSILLAFFVLPINKTHASNLENSSDQSKSAYEVGKQSDLKENSFRYKDGEPIDQGQNTSTNTPKLKDGRFSGEVGIDVSKWQGQIDWQKVKDAGINYAIIRCGYGDDQTEQDDDYWEYNVSACERLGIPYGVYLYSHADSKDHAQSELNHALRLLRGHNPQLPVYYDLEDNSIAGADLLANAEIFEVGLEKAGYKAGTYSGLNFWNNYLKDKEFGQWSRWVARYNDYCGYDKEYSIWQYCSDGTVPGIEHGLKDNRVDMNVLHNADIPNSVYKITSAVNNSSVIDINGASCDNSANAQLYGSNDTLAQRFLIKRYNNGDMNDFYKITNINSFKPLDISGANPGECTNLQQWEDNGTDAQYFKIIDIGKDKQGNKQYAFVGKCGGKCINVAGAGTANGTNIWMYHYDDTNACKFYLDKKLNKNIK